MAAPEDTIDAGLAAKANLPIWPADLQLNSDAASSAGSENFSTGPLSTKRGFRAFAAAHFGAAIDDEVFKLREELAAATRREEALMMEAGIAGASERAAKQALEFTSQSANAALRDLNQKMEALRENLTKAAESEASLKMQLQSCKAELEASTAVSSSRRARLQERATPSGRQQARLNRALACNVAREMRTAEEGRVLEKVTEKHGRSETRFVTASFTSGGSSSSRAELRWGHAPGPLNPKHCKVLDLSTVLRIDYGRVRSRCTELYPAAPPWLCFSLETTERSYDFICPDEDVVQCYVLALTRLCGAAVRGGAQSRSQFKAMKGWCKVEAYCLARHMSLAQGLLRAVRKVVAPEETATEEGSPARASYNPFDKEVGLAPASIADRLRAQQASPHVIHCHSCKMALPEDSSRFCRMCGQKRPEEEDALSASLPVSIGDFLHGSAAAPQPAPDTSPCKKDSMIAASFSLPPSGSGGGSSTEVAPASQGWATKLTGNAWGRHAEERPPASQRPVWGGLGDLIRNPLSTPSLPTAIATPCSTSSFATAGASFAETPSRSYVHAVPLTHRHRIK
eukprot:TRINITY_DN25616_c0_g2_i3.p1 TRINITY_DN25616_c0_g2~~TRINITY_DN25616_c0_g2_i3.p1  ORF type:complete len:570 (-),score=111.22 TRINITY_DN25616_c0_g2_i3:705-2414(-)